MEPKTDSIEEVETRPICDLISARLFVGSEEDSRGKDPLESLHDTAIMAAVLREAKEIEHLSGTLKTNDAAPLLHGECRYPDWNQAILAKGETEPRVSGDLEQEPSIPPGVGEMVSWGTPQRDATKNERSGVESELLSTVLTRLPDQVDGFELTQSELGNANGGQKGLKGST
jgi:hypothetical protein